MTTTTNDNTNDNINEHNNNNNNNNNNDNNDNLTSRRSATALSPSRPAETRFRQRDTQAVTGVQGFFVFMLLFVYLLLLFMLIM